MTILIVDDIASVLKMLRTSLEAEGHTVVEAIDGVHALEELARGKIDAIISDILMPRMDGYRLCYEVRRQLKFNRLPFVFFNSAYTSPQDEKLAREFGADEFFKRTSPIKNILSALERIAASAETRQLQAPGALEELAVVKQYSETLVIRLEQNNYELEQASEGLMRSNDELSVKTSQLEKARQELSRINASLEARVAERTEQLEAANKVLVTANEQLEAFGYSLSHDLKTPLSTVGGAAEMLQGSQSGLQGDQQRLVGYIAGASQRMQQIIDGMLTLAGIGHTGLATECVDFSAMTAEIVAELRKSDPTRQVECIVAPRLTLHGDAKLLRMAWENLLRNAWKFTRKKACARIEVGAESTKGETVYFVRDNGVGFGMKHAQRIFQPFERQHNQRDFPGSGIGLAIVQRIIDRHGGKIWADSEEEKGATFRFTLPAPVELIREPDVPALVSLSA